MHESGPVHSAFSLYAGRTAALTTMHRKEAALSEPLWAGAGLHLVAVTHLDTDLLGTFTGEQARSGTMLETAVAKARLGMAATGLTLGLASEGSFGPHPVSPFVPADVELVVFIDDDRGFALHEVLLTETTNYAGIVVAPGDPIDGFLSRVGFPEHWLVVRPNLADPPALVVKGVCVPGDLASAVGAACAASADGKARVETDMRAHANPTRMRVLGELAARLASRLSTRCPACAAPGWGRTEVVRGLPCHACGWPTDLVAEDVYSCAMCPYTQCRPRADRAAAPPAQCPRCNP